MITLQEMPERAPPGQLRAHLEENHTHFLLVDDGRKGVFGGEIALRTCLERAVCENQAVHKTQIPHPESSAANSARSGGAPPRLAELRRGSSVYSDNAKALASSSESDEARSHEKLTCVMVLVVVSVSRTAPHADMP